MSEIPSKLKELIGAVEERDKETLELLEDRIGRIVEAASLDKRSYELFEELIEGIFRDSKAFEEQVRWDQTEYSQEKLDLFYVEAQKIVDHPGYRMLVNMAKEGLITQKEEE